MHLPKSAHNAGAVPDRQKKPTRRSVLRGATALIANPSSMSGCENSIADPVIALIAEEKRWRLLAVAARASAEAILFALPRNEWPQEFDDHPMMAEALSLEQRADAVYGRIIETPANTLAGIFGKLEWGEGDTDVTKAAIADLRRCLRT